jgi:hypothetical protein
MGQYFCRTGPRYQIYMSEGSAGHSTDHLGRQSNKNIEKYLALQALNQPHFILVIGNSKQLSLNHRFRMSVIQNSVHTRSIYSNEVKTC